MTTRSHEKDGGVLQWLYEQGEEALTQLADELSKNRSLTDALGRAVKQAAHTKGRLDKNMQTVLSLLNVPSRGDYQKLLTKIETLQGSLVNVNIKLDRIMAALASQPKAPKKKAAS
jgi:broad specificity phosphatase PhoE